MRKTYPNDVTREQFAVVRGTLEAAKKETHPRTITLIDALERGGGSLGVPVIYGRI